MRLSFRNKILISYVLGFLIFLAAMYPLASHTVKEIVTQSIYERSYELIEKIQDAPDDNALVQKLKDQKYLIFFRVSLITDERKLLYDSYTKRLLGKDFNKKLALNHPEVEEAFQEGYGLYEGYSKLLHQRFVYIAETFDFHGKTYVLRIAFPYRFISELTRDVEFGFLGLGSAAMILFSLMTWFIIHRLTRPIQAIIEAIKPYQQGHVTTLPEIMIPYTSSSDDLGKLAETLNSLSAKVQSHINILTHERNEKEAVLESLVEGVIAVDNNLIVTYANQAALKLLCITREELIDHPFSVTGQQQCLDILAKCQQEKKALNESLTIKREGESKIYLELIASPKKENSGAVLVMEDQSGHYKLIEMRKNFIANASHELKTPITIIRGFAETLQDNPDLPAETQAMVVNKIVNNCQRMTTLIKNLLTLTDIEHIPLSRLLECNLYALIHNCRQMLKDLYPEAIVTFEKRQESSITLLADPLLLEMAVMNILENAVKYSSSPAIIGITVDRDPEMNSVKLIISDRGMGIPENEIENIFQRFHTVNKAHSRKLGGSGLGLAIVETIVEKHGGSIAVISKVGEGTSFTIKLPIG